MNEIYAILGMILLIAGIIDFAWTTLWPDGGAGPITKRVSLLFWVLLRWLSGGKSSLISLAGPIILIATLLTWILLFWTGWTLLFAADPASFIDTNDNNPISWAERWYVTGYLLFTLGVGDYIMEEGLWQILAVLTAACGLVFITLGVTYILSVLDAVTQKRAFAESVRGIGDNVTEIVSNSWNGKNFNDINLLLSSFSSQLSTLTSQHNAYPILHYYHSSKRDEELAVSVATLDEVLTVFKFGIKEGYGPNKLLIHEARSTIDSFITTLRNGYISPAEMAPPPPDLDTMRDKGLPVVSTDVFLDSLEDLSARRKALLGSLRDNSRKWPD
ncbi:two pore domain potassium channel family protein [Planomicrobium sp. Y74]|uniref:two pore domain potassium channel family protein n=1 Tax=Planomicrobium sp. Y74 TaxID=2478977 RepID=UPI000EF4B8EE|nr:two pore domain potassium channel family protein [Planomicrobium sp. Y74]RLQ83871.1 two pore domain potassium channel family protein [Planomicrobium sp. Y74]